MKRVLLINGHPDPESFNYSLAEAYATGAASAEVRFSRIDLAALDFDPILRYGYRQRTELEPDLLDAIEQLKQADHVVWIFPIWWYGLPALMKGFIDRTFLPGITFQYVEGKPLPQQLLTGKSARLIITADTPRWYDFLVMKRPAIHQFKQGTLQFCGINPVKVTYIAPIRQSTPAFRTNWLKRVAELGEKVE